MAKIKELGCPGRSSRPVPNLRAQARAARGCWLAWLRWGSGLEMTMTAARVGVLGGWLVCCF